VQVSADGKAIMQSRGHSNRDLTEDESKFLDKYRDHLDPSRQKSLFNVAEDLAINHEIQAPEADPAVVAEMIAAMEAA
jgi:hypothetical protein